MTKPKIISNDPKEDIAPVLAPVEYSFEPKTLKELVKQSAGIQLIQSAKDVASVMPFIAALRLVRITLDTERKTQKAGVLIHGRLVDSEAAKLVDIIKPEEDRLQAIRKEFEDAAALVKQQELETEKQRTDLHKQTIQHISETPAKLIECGYKLVDLEAQIVDFEDIDIALFEEFGEQASGAIGTAISTLKGMLALLQRKEEQDKIAAEQTETQRVIDEEKEAVEANRLANEKEAKRIAQEEIDRKVKFEHEQKRAAQKITDDKAAAKQAAIDKKAAVKAEKKRLADIEKAKPDAEKLQVLANTLLDIELPELQVYQNRMVGIKEDIEVLADRIKSTANEMIS